MPKQGTCENCGNEGLIGYLACEKKWICPVCAAKQFGADPQEVAVKLEVDNLNIGMAKRALLGGGKGTSVMELIRQNNPEYYRHIMKSAKEELEKEGVKFVKLPNDM